MRWNLITRSAAASLFLFLLIYLAGCSKKQIVSTEPDALSSTSAKTTATVARGVTPLGYGGTNGITRVLYSDNVIAGATTKVEIAIWQAPMDGEHNSVYVGVDPGFVLVGGGAQVVDRTGDYSSIDAVLTSAFPVNDGTFSTYSAASKDHGIVYPHRLYVYAIGMKLWGTDGNPIPTSTVIPYLSLTSSQSPGLVSLPTATATAPIGYSVLSGGADINYGSGFGSLLVEDSYDPSTFTATSWGKDQKTSSPASITTYCLSMNTNSVIPGFGRLLVHYDKASTPIVSHLQGIVIEVPRGYLMAGLGGFSNYNSHGGYGRLLFTMYPETPFYGRCDSKDQIASDLSGTLDMIMTEVAPAQ